MKVGVSLPADLVSFADEEARKRGTTRSGLLAELLEAERVQKRLRAYLDQHGWDVVEDEESWRKYQSQRVRDEYCDDDWSPTSSPRRILVGPTRQTLPR